MELWMVRGMNFIVKYTKLYMIIYFAHALELAGSLGNCDLWQEWSFPMSLSRKCWKSSRTRFRWKTGIMRERYEIHMRYHFLAALQDLVQEMWQWSETVWFSKMIVRQSDAQHIRFEMLVLQPGSSFNHLTEAASLFSNLHFLVPIMEASKNRP